MGLNLGQEVEDLVHFASTDWLYLKHLSMASLCCRLWRKDSTNDQEFQSCQTQEGRVTVFNCNMEYGEKMSIISQGQNHRSF